VASQRDENAKQQQDSTFHGARLLEAGDRVLAALRRRRSDQLRKSFLGMTLRREALRCRARLNLLAPRGLYLAHSVSFSPALEVAVDSEVEGEENEAPS